MIPAGQTSFTVDITIIDDSIVEPSRETFSINLQLEDGGDGGVTISGTGTGTIDVVDDDGEYNRAVHK